MRKYLRAHGKPWIERVLTPSLSIIYPPYSKSRKRIFFLYFFPFRLDEIKVGGDSCLPRHFANTKCKTQTNIKQSVLPPSHSNYIRQDLIIEAKIFLDPHHSSNKVIVQEFKVITENSGHCISMYLFQYILPFSQLCNYLWSLSIHGLPSY